MSKTLRLLGGAFLLLVVGAISGITRENPATAHGGLGFCGPDVRFVQETSGTVSQSASGIFPLQLTAPPQTSGVVFELTGEVILGHAERLGNDGATWGLMWDTRFAESDFQYEVSAEVTSDDGSVCKGATILLVTPDNEIELELDPEVSPEFWQGPTNTVGWFNVFYEDDFPAGTQQNVYKYADVSWSVTKVGTISGRPGGVGRFYAGPQPGSGTVTARVSYGGSVAEAEVDVEVFEQYVQTDSSTPPSSSEGAGDDDADDTGDEITDAEESLLPEIQATRPATISQYIESFLDSNEQVSSCVETEIGAGVDRLIAANRRPTESEFSAFVDCFAVQEYVLPSVLAPVAPEEVVRRPQSSDVAVGSITNRDVIASDGSSKTALVLSGTATPNTNVLIYVFSEPLVLVATADDNGNWEYVLEDPLPGGEHEVYALVDRGDGEYERSSLASFFVGTAEATEDNPNGYSLELISEPTIAVNNRSANVFIASTIGLTVFTVTAFGGFIVYRFRNRDAGANTTEGTPSSSV